MNFTQAEGEEFNKCYIDPVYFIENYIKITVPVSINRVQCKLWDSQKRTINNFHQHKLNVCVAPRQSGKSLCLSAYALHYCIFNANYIIGILSGPTISCSRDFINIIKGMYEDLPNFLKPSMIINSIESLVLGNGSKIVALSSKESMVGKNFDLFIYDEFGFAKADTSSYVSNCIIPAQMLTSGKMILSGTVTNTNHEFYKIYSEAVNNTNSFNPITINWNEIPGRDQKFKDDVIEMAGQQSWDQEYGCEFIK